MPFNIPEEYRLEDPRSPDESLSNCVPLKDPRNAFWLLVKKPVGVPDEDPRALNEAPWNDPPDNLDPPLWKPGETSRLSDEKTLELPAEPKLGRV